MPLLRLLSEGSPVTVSDLATASGRSEDTVRRGLSVASDTEYVDVGRVIGLALTLRPTPHRFAVEGRQLYTWCALDTLFFPALIGKAATIESTSPGSGSLVRVTTGADGTITSVHPDTAVLSVMVPDDDGPVRSSFCNQVHYFASPRGGPAMVGRPPRRRDFEHWHGTPGRRRHRGRDAGAGRFPRFRLGHTRCLLELIPSDGGLVGIRG